MGGAGIIFSSGVVCRLAGASDFFSSIGGVGSSIVCSDGADASMVACDEELSVCTEVFDVSS